MLYFFFAGDAPFLTGLVAVAGEGLSKRSLFGETTASATGGGLAPSGLFEKLEPAPMLLNGVTEGVSPR